MDFFAAQDTILSYYDTKMLLKVVFKKTAFIKFKINSNFKLNIDRSQQKIRKKIHTSLQMLTISRKKSAN